jgi:hypothetical protein
VHSDGDEYVLSLIAMLIFVSLALYALTYAPSAAPPRHQQIAAMQRQALWRCFLGRRPAMQIATAVGLPLAGLGATIGKIVLTADDHSHNHASRLSVVALHRDALHQFWKG